MKVKQIKIEFQVTPEIKRFVYVYLVETNQGCVLIDSGVAGSEAEIERATFESGHDPKEIKAVFLTHAHPDHIGTANYFREKYGAKIYAGEGERRWIENIDLQFQERPIPNFYSLAGKSTPVDQVVKNGDVIYLSDDMYIQVIATPGHSADHMSYRIEDRVFIGDTVPVRGDIPIFINLNDTRHSLEVLGQLPHIKIFYPAWDETYSLEMMGKKLLEAEEIVDELENIVCELDGEMNLSDLVPLVCDRIGVPMWKANPLFARTVDCCRRRK